MSFSITASPLNIPNVIIESGDLVEITQKTRSVYLSDSLLDLGQFASSVKQTPGSCGCCNWFSNRFVGIIVILVCALRWSILSLLRLYWISTRITMRIGLSNTYIFKRWFPWRLRILINNVLHLLHELWFFGMYECVLCLAISYIYVAGFIVPSKLCAQMTPPSRVCGILL